MPAAQNIYQMVMDSITPAPGGTEGWRHRGPVLVRRNSWRSGLAEIVGFDVAPEAWPADKAPYYGNPKVYALIKYRAGEPYALDELSSPGTFAYERLRDVPAWWRGGLNYPVVGHSRHQRIELAADGTLSFLPGTGRRS